MPNRITLEVAAILLGLALIAGAVHNWKASIAREAVLRSQNSAWKARYAEAATTSVRVADTVIKNVVKTKTLRDTVLAHITDTAIVKNYVYVTDTLRVSCERCANQLRLFKATADSTIGSLNATIGSLTPSLGKRMIDRTFQVLLIGGAFYLGMQAKR